MLLKKALLIAGTKPSPPVIPLNGKKRLAERDYFSAGLYDKDRDYLLASADNNEIRVKTLENGAYGDPHTISIVSIKDMQFVATHYYKEQEIRYTSAAKFIFFHSIKYHRFAHILEVGTQRAYNKTRLAKSNRMEVLSHMLDRRRANPEYCDSPHGIVYQMNSFRAVNHPNWEIATAEMHFILESLVESGDAEIADAGLYYSPTPKGFVTFANHAEDMERHRFQTSLQIMGAVFAGSSALGALFKQEQIQQFFLDIFAFINQARATAVAIIQSIL